MPSANVSLQIPVTRFNTLYPGQLGVLGTSNSVGLRTHCTGSVFYVDPNFPGASDLRDGTDSDCPFRTLQAAVNACQNWHGDEIYVMHNNDWQYGPGGTDHALCIDEDVIVNKHGIRIVGVAQSSPLGVMWRPATNLGVACTINSLDVVIEGFCFMGSLLFGGTAISCVWNGTTAWGENTVIRHNFFGDDIDVGISFAFAWNCHIYENEFQRCDTAGLYCDPAGSPLEYCVIKDNIFTDAGLASGGAMAISEAENCTIKNNVIFNSAAQAGAACVNEGINTSAGGGANMICDNYFSCTLGAVFDSFCSADALDAWVGNWCMNGAQTAPPA